MPLQKVLAVTAGVFSVLGFVPYVRAILNLKPGAAAPQKASWIIWAVLDSIVLAGMYAGDTLNFQIVTGTTGAWGISFLLLKYGASGWRTIDKWCLAGAGLSLALWGLYRDPLFGIMTSLATLFLGAVPTWIAAWRDPNGESLAAWSLFMVSCVTGVLAIPAWTWGDAAQPIAFLIINTVVITILLVRPTFLASSAYDLP